MANRKSTKRIIIHCADTYPDMDIGVQEIDRWHRQRGWNGCGYHFVIRRDGTVEKGRDLMVPGAHTRGHNSTSVGVCLVGGKHPKDQEEPCSLFEPVQLQALSFLLFGLVTDFPDADITPHCALDRGKTCPNFCVDTWLKTGELITIQPE